MLARWFDCRAPRATEAAAGLNDIAGAFSPVLSSPVRFGLCGTVKAGKSTLGLSIVGVNISPSRTTTMTVLPTVMHHNARQTKPRLLLPHTALNALVSVERAALEFISRAPTGTAEQLSAVTGGTFADKTAFEDAQRDFQKRQQLCAWALSGGAGERPWRDVTFDIGDKDADEFKLVRKAMRRFGATSLLSSTLTGEGSGQVSVCQKRTAICGVG